MKISVCIPMYNESKIIADTARQLHEYMSANFSGEDSYELIFADDGSADGCADIVRGLELPCARVLRYEKNRGKGCAVRTAVLAAEGDIVMFTDADLAYGTGIIGDVRRIFDENPGADMLIGSRRLSSDGYEGYTPLRRLMSGVFVKILCVAGGFNLSDSQSACKAFRAKAAGDIFGRCEIDRFAFDFEVILWAQKLGYKIIEMPVKIINHRDSTVRLFRDSFKMLRDMFKIKRRVKKSQV